MAWGRTFLTGLSYGSGRRLQNLIWGGEWGVGGRDYCRRSHQFLRLGQRSPGAWAGSGLQGPLTAAGAEDSQLVELGLHGGLSRQFSGWALRCTPLLSVSVWGVVLKGVLFGPPRPGPESGCPVVSGVEALQDKLPLSSPCAGPGGERRAPADLPLTNSGSSR